MLSDLEKVITDVYALLKKKNQMYGDSNIEKHGVQGIIIRLDDKLSRIKNLLGTNYKDEESIIDTAMDMIGYLVHFIRLEKQSERPTDKIGSIIKQLENLSLREKTEFLGRLDTLLANNKNKKHIKQKEFPYKVEPKKKAKEKFRVDESESYTIITFPEKLSVKEAQEFFSEFYDKANIQYDTDGDILYVENGILQAAIRGNKIILSMAMDNFDNTFLTGLIDKYNITDIESSTSTLKIK